MTEFSLAHRTTSAVLAVAAIAAVSMAQGRGVQPQTAPQTAALIPAGAVQILYVNTPGHPTNIVPGLGIPFQTGGGTTNFGRPVVSPDDTHVAFEALTNSALTTDDNVLILDGALLLQEGTQAPWAVAGELVGTIDDEYGLNNAGNLLIGNNTGPTTVNDDYIALFTNAGATWSVLAQEAGLVDPFLPALAGAAWNDIMQTCRLTTAGVATWHSDVLTGGGLVLANDEVMMLPNGTFLQEGVTIPPGQAGGGVATWENFSLEDMHVSADGLTWLVQGDTNAATTVDLILTVNGAVVIQEGTILPGSPFVTNVSAIGKSWLDNAGNWYARGSNATSAQDWLVRNGTIVATSDAGDPIVPGSLETWSDTDFASCFFCMDGNSSGAFVFGGVTTNASTNNGVIVYDDGIGNRMVVVREGDPIDLNGNGVFDDDRFFNTFGDDDVLLLENGDVLFTATLENGLGAAVDQGIFRVKPGAATCEMYNGNNINTLEFECNNPPVLGASWQLDLTPNGSTVLTFLLLGFAPSPPIPVFTGELLVDLTGVETHTGGGIFNFNVPNLSIYQGFPLYLQGARVDGANFVVLNAIKATLGL